MFVFNPGSIPPVRFGPGGTDPAEISISAVTYIMNRKPQSNYNRRLILATIRRKSILMSPTINGGIAHQPCGLLFIASYHRIGRVS